MGSLQDKVAVVAGATRGAGRGIACALGEAGATVYCTGRSVRGNPAAQGRLETIEETAEFVTARGGIGIPVRVDHTVEKQVTSLFEQVDSEQGHLDVLVNDVWGGDELTEWGTPFWKLSCEKGLLMLERAVLAHIITSRHGMPLMLRTGSGLVVEVTDGDETINRFYRGNLFYDLVKISAMRLAFAMAHELRDTEITAVALTPGFLRSEMMLEHFGVTEETWQGAIQQDPYFAHSETPLYIGRAIVALASDPYVKEKAGRALATWHLAKEYELTDADGRQPDIGTHIEAEAARRWAELVPAVRAEFEGHDRDPDRDFADDVERMELRGNMNPGSTSARWFSWPVSFPDLLMRDPKTVAVEFSMWYRDALRRQGAE